MPELLPVRHGLATGLVLYITLSDLVYAAVLIIGGLNVLHTRSSILGFITVLAASVPLTLLFATLRNKRWLQLTQAWLYAALALIIVAIGAITHALATLLVPFILVAASASAQFVLLRIRVGGTASHPSS